MMQPNYALSRMLLMVPTMLGITLLVFVITRFVPGGPIEQLMAASEVMSQEASSDRFYGALTDEDLEGLRSYYGFDRPILESYGQWLCRMLQGDFGTSTRTQEPVWQVIGSRLSVSLGYGFVTMLLTYLICVPLGILKALYHQSWFDKITTLVVYIGYAIPGFVLGLLLLMFVSVRWDWLPMGGVVSDGFHTMDVFDQLKDLATHALLPLCSYLASSLAVTTFLMKNALLENISSDYMRTAVAKGLRYRHAVLSHALKNSLVPVITHFGKNLSALLGGAFLIEKIFDIDGLGLLGYHAVIYRDYPTVMAILLMVSMLQLVGHLVADILIALVDPRVRFSYES